MSARNRRFSMAGSLIALVAAGTVALVVGETHAAVVTRGTIVQNTGKGFYDEDLRTLLDNLMPTANAQSTLIVFTECYGGDKLDNFAGRAGTTVLSATSPGETAKYGGYDNDAAAALDAGPGRTSATVHAAGVAGKHPSETPLSQGPGASLEDTNPGAGPIKSRHVLYYAGMPDGSANPAHTDNAYRDRIKANFAGDVATTVTTAGGSGLGDGYDYPGTFNGMANALDAINNSMNPDEQFILFISDHGDLDKSEKAPVCGAGTCTSGSLALGSTLYSQMLAEPANTPRVSLLSPGPSDPGLVTINLSGGQIWGTATFTETVDADHDGDLTDPGDGRVAALNLDESLINPAGHTVTVTGSPALSLSIINLESGAIAKVGGGHNAIPTLSEWGVIGLILLMAASALWMLRRRSTAPRTI